MVFSVWHDIVCSLLTAGLQWFREIDEIKGTSTGDDQKVLCVPKLLVGPKQMQINKHGAPMCSLFFSGLTTNNIEVWNESRACYTVGRPLTHAWTTARSHSWACGGWRKTVYYIITRFFLLWFCVLLELWSVHFYSIICMYIYRCSIYVFHEIYEFLSISWIDR